MNRFLACLCFAGLFIALYSTPIARAASPIDQSKAEKDKAREERLKRHRELIEKHKARMTEMKKNAKSRSQPKRSERKKRSTPNRTSISSRHRNRSNHSSSSASGKTNKPKRVGYAVRKQSEFGYRVTMQTVKYEVPMKWTGDVYCYAVYGITELSRGELVVLGKLQGHRYSEKKKAWFPYSADNISFPRHITIGSAGASQHSSRKGVKEKLPMQMSAIMPMTEFLFTDIPANGKDSEFRGSQTYMLVPTGGSFARIPFKTIKTKTHVVRKIKNPQSSSPTVTKTESFYNKEKRFGMTFSRTTRLVSAGIPGNSDMEFLVRWDGDCRLKSTIRPLNPADLKKAKARAFKEFPYAKWPARLKRVSLERSKLQQRFTDAKNHTVGSTVAVTIVTNTTHRHYKAKVIDIDSKSGRLKLKLAGSNELMTKSYTAIHKLR